MRGRASAGDPGTLEAIESAGRALGIGVAATVNVVDPSAVVLGGLYASLEPWLRKPLQAELRERVISQSWAPVRVLASSLGPDAAVRGAAGAVVREVLSNPTAVLRAVTSVDGMTADWYPFPHDVLAHMIVLGSTFAYQFRGEPACYCIYRAFGPGIDRGRRLSRACNRTHVDDAAAIRPEVL